jgi:hypothetical protein
MSGSTRPWFLAFVIVFLIILAVGVLLLLDPDTTLSEDPLDPFTPPAVHADPESGSSNREPGISLPDGSIVIAEPDDDERSLMAPAGSFIAGRVQELETAEAIPHFDLEIHCRDNLGEWSALLHETVRHEDGRFHFPLPRSGRARLTVRSPRHCPCEDREVILPDGGRLEGVVIELDPGFRLSGEVTAGDTGEPVPAALVLPYQYRSRYDLAWLQAGFDAYCAHTRTDENGFFSLQGLDWEDATRKQWTRIAVFHPDFAPGDARVYPSTSKEIRVSLQPGFRIFGRVSGDGGSPVEGVAIFGKMNHGTLFRTVTTGPDGRYRTAPFHPGKVHLVASAPVDHDGPVPGFTEEDRIVELSERDLEVNFGPDPGHLTWRGTLYDPAGEPIKRGRIEVRPLKKLEGARATGGALRAADTDQAGRFEFKKLYRDVYEIVLSLSDPITRIQWGELNLDGAGLVERDIRLAGSAVEGVVLDGLLGSPVEGRLGSVNATQREGRFLTLNTQIDGKGNFRFIGLEPGEYDLRASIKDFPLAESFEVIVQEGRPLKGVELTVPSGGRVRFKLWGFENLETPAFNLELERDGVETFRRGIQQLDGRGVWTEEQVLERGAWKISASFPGLGYLERSFEVLHGETLEVFLHRSQMIPFPPPLALTGILVAKDGTAMARKGLRFEPWEIWHYFEDLQPLSCSTDEEGRFSLKGVAPGCWQPRVLLGQGCEVRLPVERIAGQGREPVHLKLVFPGGSVRGRLFDEKTGKPFEGYAPRWWITLEDSRSREPVSRIDGGRTGSDFELVGIGAGEYRIEITALGFFDYRSSPFQLEEGASLDLGELALSPCGVLDIAVKDGEGKPLLAPRVFCDGKFMSERTRRYLGPGRYRYYKVPLGSSVLKVQARGFDAREVIIELLPGRIESIEVTLQGSGG